MDRLEKLINEVLEEEKSKRDRCLRIADRKFDKPSAYKSGAVVRCRQGKIWKGIKEEVIRVTEKQKKHYVLGLHVKVNLVKKVDGLIVILAVK
jgi:hypothetical protein